MTAQAGDTFELKRALRRELRRRRAAIPPAERRRCARRALKHLQRLPAWRRSRVIAAYFASGSEMPTTDLLAMAARQGRRIAVPRISSKGVMRFVEYHPTARLHRNRYGIPEPRQSRRFLLSEIDLMLTPLVGFDLDGYRLGAGGGYYDRFLSRRRGRRPICLGWALSAQCLESVPRDPWDCRLDGVITEKGVSGWLTG